MYMFFFLKLINFKNIIKNYYIHINVQMNENTSLITKEYYSNSYRSYITQKHSFNSNNICENCSIRNKDLRTLIHCDRFLNPYNLNMMALDNGYDASVELYDIYYDKFEIKFPADNNSCYYEPFFKM